MNWPTVFAGLGICAFASMNLGLSLAGRDPTARRLVHDAARHVPRGALRYAGYAAVPLCFGVALAWAGTQGVSIDEFFAR